MESSSLDRAQKGERTSWGRLVMLASLCWRIWSEGLQALWVRVLSLPTQHLRGHGPYA